MKIRSRFLTRLAAAGMVRLIKTLFWTTRLEMRLSRPETSPYVLPRGDQRVIYCVWHDSVIVPTFAGRQPCTAALVSQHQDGSYLANTLEMVGISTVRGSASRGGAQAVRQLMDEARSRHLVLTPDGPRGPRRTLKPGLAFLASNTGRPVVPTAFSATKEWRVQGSWTDLMVPRPFSTVYLLTGHPIFVPPKLSREGLTWYTELIQESMDQLAAEAERLAAGIHTPPPQEWRSAA